MVSIAVRATSRTPLRLIVQEGKVGIAMTQETEEVLEMTENPEEVMQEEGIEIEQPPA
jgi:hypothetical protein